ncbi:Predicted arabinose efflux permease, MFS family [Kosakonia radicincitans]|uniref:MFS transporter n=1 Tax=Kosakonia radicincitans TaxID=283686 RepID=UPI0009A71101|nr:MFS transporter [Kosakonia radicincitans]SKC21963.1 Predicted arabinose efflux permease, MFS family [Kosakonia radicincitans]
MTQQNELKAAVTVSPVQSSASAWQPLHQRVFRMLWIATVVSNIGSWMSDIGVNWTMLSLSADPLAVALVQAASSLPMFLFVLPAGVLADIIERRKILLFSQVWSFCAAAGLALLSFTGNVTPEVLLAATFLLSTGAALSSPAFQAIVPDLVDKQELSPAIALNSLGINISRAIGPALGGLILSFAGPWMVFLLNALSVVGVAVVLHRWKPQATVQRLPPEHFFTAIRGGLRYVHAAPVLQNVLARTVAFFLFGSAGWAMLPLVARRELGLGPGGYGIMLACIGVGAICGAVVLPKLRKRLNADQMMVAASLLFAITMLALAFIRHVWLLNAFEFFTGFSWIAVLSTLNVGAQRSAARWVKARALAVYLTVFFGSMTVGSAIWGKLASEFGVAWSLCAATVGMVLGATTVLRWRLEKDAALNLDILDPAGGTANITIPHERGPVMVSCEYRIDPQDAHEFTLAMQDMRRVRRRTGAMGWAVYEDAVQPGVFVETWVMGSWIEHLRQHERHTVNDQRIRERVLAFHQSDEPPVVRHLVAPAGR